MLTAFQRYVSTGICIGNTCNILTYVVITICFSLLYIGTAVIQGPDVVIYRSNEEPVELICVITEGSTGWRLNGSTVFTLSEIRDGGLPDHTINGSNLVIINATNNTEYICVSIRDVGDLDSNPVRLYIAGMLHNYTVVLQSCITSTDY